MCDRTDKSDFGMTGDEIFCELNANLEESPENADLLINFSVMQLQWIHARALACHCECLGMNAENALAVCGDYVPPYTDKDYFKVMEKWGLSDEKGNPII